MKIGIITCHTLLDHARSRQENLLIEDDIEFVSWLQTHQIDVSLLAWTSDDPMKHSDLSLVLIRTPWDYQSSQEAFLAYLAAFEARGIPLLNPLSIVRWNIDKHYLRDLADVGVFVTPTHYLEAGESDDLLAIMAAHGWQEIVLKPAIAAGGKDAFRLHRDAIEAFLPHFQTIRGDRAWLSQPFLQEVLSDGEWSLLYFDGVYSHSVRKYAKHGEFRVQDDHGGTCEWLDAPAEIVLQADQIMAALTLHLPTWTDCKKEALPLLYARIDGIVTQGRFALSELELIEPELFLRAHADASSCFAKAIHRRIDALAANKRSAK